MYDYAFYVDSDVFNPDDEYEIIEFLKTILPDYWFYAKQPVDKRFALIYFIDNETQDALKIIYLPESAFGYANETVEIKFNPENFSSFEEFATNSIEIGFIYVYKNEIGEYIAVGPEEVLDGFVEKIHSNIGELLNPSNENIQIIENYDFTEFQIMIASELLTDELESQLIERFSNVIKVIHSMAKITEKDHFTIEFVDQNSGETLKRVDKIMIFEQ